ncbi:hypothetical protein VTK73DRAFT_6019 [Phialemonium thermophilum]|uniref:HTH La-type RNA-binding domain-containing protein n=1 Tax=Phialemonium thermophilum TaxID=223376 RepID=A0ABR3WLC5_9PEZI
MSNTTFSYAQAAKGHVAPQTSPQPTSVSAPSSTTSQSRDDVTGSSNSLTTPSVVSNDIEFRETGKSAQPEGESISQKQGSNSSLNTEPSQKYKPPVETSAEVPPADESSVTDAVKNIPRSASRTSRSADGGDRKGRKNKSAKGPEKDVDSDKPQEDEKEKEALKPVMLSEAPIPAVNVWQKRIEELQSKTKVTSPTSPSTTASGPGVTAGDASKQRAVESSDISSALQIGVNGEKSQKKVTEPGKPNDQMARRSLPRGSRTGDSLPPVADATSWPDPKSAASAAVPDEGKRRPQEKTERTEKEGQEDSGPLKRQKEKWITMAYVPTVNFQTPIPQRTSKPRGGARGGREQTARGSHTSTMASGVTSSVTSPVTDKAPAQTASSTKEPRPRDSGGTVRAASLPPNASKRPAPDFAHPRDARKPSAPPSTERSKDVSADAVPVTGAKGETTRPSRSEPPHQNVEQSQSITRPHASERRAEKGFESAREGGSSTTKEHAYPARERGEGRGERGRGGFRGRGGHPSSLGGHGQFGGFPSNGQYAVQTIPGSHGPYSPPAHQAAFFGNGPTRGSGRGSGRGNTGSSAFSRNSSNNAGSAPKVPHVNTANIPFDYPVQPFPTYGFPAPYYDPTTIQLLMLQVEYYLSVDNLCKDFFIRKRMDSKGFVPLSVIANFNRMRDLAPDLDAIRLACEQSDKIDYVVGEDHVERLRLHDKWDRFVLSMEEREEEARNDGPVHFSWKSRHTRPYPGPVVMPGYPTTSPTMFAGTFHPEDAMYPPPYVNGGPYEPVVNGDVNGHRYGIDSQLSAAVPEFSPSGPVPFTLESATTFSDKQVEGLKVLIGYDRKDISQPEIQIDRERAAENGVVVNGAGNAPQEVSGNDIVQSSREPEPRSPSNSYPNVIWAKQQKGDASDAKEEPYLTFREKALEQRRSAKPGETPRAMKNLYEFWSHFLIGRFNAKMYEEFRSCAIEDASRETPSKVGLKFLLNYYKELFSSDTPKPWGSDRPIPEIFTLHYQGAAIMDPALSANGDGRP